MRPHKWLYRIKSTEQLNTQWIISLCRDKLSKQLSGKIDEISLDMKLKHKYLYKDEKRKITDLFSVPYFFFVYDKSYKWKSFIQSLNIFCFIRKRKKA